MEEYLEMNIKLEIQLILFLLDVCILSEGERGRNLDPCQIDNFVSTLILTMLTDWTFGSASAPPSILFLTTNK